MVLTDLNKDEFIKRSRFKILINFFFYNELIKNLWNFNMFDVLT